MKRNTSKEIYVPHCITQHSISSHLTWHHKHFFFLYISHDPAFTSNPCPIFFCKFIFLTQQAPSLRNIVTCPICSQSYVPAISILSSLYHCHWQHMSHSFKILSTYYYYHRPLYLDVCVPCIYIPVYEYLFTVHYYFLWQNLTAV